MSEPKRPRPVGIAILAWLHIISGVVCIVAGAFLSFKLSRNSEFTDSLTELGVPPMLLLAAVNYAVITILVCVSGVGMWMGAKWGWFLGSFYYAFGVLRNLSALVTTKMLMGVISREEFARVSHAPGFYYADHGAQLVVFALLYLYCFKANVRAYFGLEKGRKWKAVSLQVGVCILLMLSFDVAAMFATSGSSGSLMAMDAKIQHGEEGIVTAGFKRIVWSEKLRARVNSPDVATGPYKDRWEAKETGLVTVTLDDDPSGVTGAHVYLELWGGHPGVAEKSFTLAEKKYLLPEVGAAGDNCTYSYPIVEIDAAKLVQGENVLAFSCMRGTTFWGHYIIDNTALVLDLTRTHGDIRKMGLGSFEASVSTLPPAGRPEALALSVSLPEGLADKVACVEYRGRYTGYDENGDGKFSDWHGFTKGRRAEAIIGRADRPPYEVIWDTSMLADQDGPLEVQALVRFKGSDSIVYVTAPLGNLALPKRDGRAVGMFAPEGLPRPFWSRASEVKTCIINLPVEVKEIERAQLHVNIWDGGRGDVIDPFTLNGHPLPVAGGGEHDLIYRVVEIDPSILKKGANEIRLLSDTEHHGIEVLLPGPTLVVRYTNAAQ